MRRPILLAVVILTMVAQAEWGMGQWKMDLLAGEKQLFLDDLVISKAQNLKRVLHQPVKHPGNPVIRPEHPRESLIVQTRNAPFWDPPAKVWKLYYFAFVDVGKDGDRHTSCYAESKGSSSHYHSQSWGSVSL